MAKIMIHHNSEVNDVIQDHRILQDWSDVQKNDTIGNATEFILSVDMQFNEGHRLSIICLSCLMVISSIANSTVLYLLTKRRLRGASRIDIMLTHLAIADLLVTFLLMPMEIAWAYTVTWNAGDLMCRLMSFFRTFGLYLSSFVIICLSIDRYFAVLKPLTVSDIRGRMMLACAWITSVLFSIPQAIIFHVEVHPEVQWFQQCVTFHSFPDEFHNILYSILGMLAMYAIPLIVIIFCYTSIYIEIYRNTKTGFSRTERFRRSNDDVLSRAKRRTLKMTFTIVAVFVICWTPFYVMSMWYWIDRDSAIKIDQRVQKGLFIFASTNSCMNPLVYGIFNIRSRDNNLNNTLNNRHTSISKRVEALTGSTKRNGHNNGTSRMDSSNSITIGILQSKSIPIDQRPRSGSVQILDDSKILKKNQLINGNNIGNNHNSRQTVCSRSVSIDEKPVIICGEKIELPDMRKNDNYH